MLFVRKPNSIASKSFNRLLGNRATKISQLKMEGCAIRYCVEAAVFRLAQDAEPVLLPVKLIQTIGILFVHNLYQ